MCDSLLSLHQLLTAQSLVATTPHNNRQQLSTAAAAELFWYCLVSTDISLIQAAVSGHCQLVLRHRRGRMTSAAAAPILIPGCDKMSPVSRRVRNGSDSSDNGSGSSCSGSGTNSPVYFGRTSPGAPAPKVEICQYFLHYITELNDRNIPLFPAPLYFNSTHIVI